MVLLVGTDEVATWPLVSGRAPDLELVDDLARLQLMARRLGCAIGLRESHDELTELLALVGLAGLLEAAPGGQVVGQAEGGEQVGVEEVVVTDDPIT